MHFRRMNFTIPPTVNKIFLKTEYAVYTMLNYLKIQIGLLYLSKNN